MGGGGSNSSPQLGQTSNLKQAPNKAKNFVNFASKGIKTKYKTQRTTQMMLWLLVFCVFAVFSLCPLAGLATRYNLTAGGPSDDTFYINAPVFIAGDSARSATTGSADTSTGVANANIKPLFKTGGTVDAEVLADLLNMVDSESVWKGTTENTNAPTYLSAKNFGQYGNLTGNKAGNAQILVKLFDTVGETDSNINQFTSQYWQAVYRSIRDKNGTLNDVLTLYMARPYLTSQTFDSSYGNYSTSDIRDVILADYTTLIGDDYFSKADQYIVAPYQLSSSGASDMSKTTVENGTYLNLGGWQSSAYQTSARGLTSKTPSISSGNNWMSGTTDEIHTGASGYCDAADSSWGYEYGVNNGLDGLGDGWKSWSSIDTNYADKLWLPSGFEVLHTGYGQTATSQLQNTGRLYDEANDIIYLDSNYSKATAGINSEAYTSSHKNANRTGLWELNAYDRASNSWAWLRSGYSSDDYSARGLSWDGDDRNDGVNYTGGVRVALHLSLGALTKELCKVSASAQSGYIAAKNVVFNSKAAKKYNPYIVKSSTNSSNSQYSSTSFKLVYDSSKILKSLILNSSTQSIELSSLTAGQTYTASGICDYAVSAVTTNSDGDNEITITISNAKTSEVNVKYQITDATQEYAVAFRATFVNTDSDKDAGLVIYILRADGVGGYAEFYSVFVKREEKEQTFEFTLQGGMTYTILVFKPYLWKLTLDGTEDITKTTFTPQSNNEIHTIVASGGDIPNNYTVV